MAGEVWELVLGVVRDPVWQFVGAILAAVAIVVTVYLARSQSRKSLTYDVLVATPVLRVTDRLKGKIQILYEGAPAEDVHLVAILFSNSGRVPIKVADYVEPLTISLGESATILSAETWYAWPRALRPEFVTESGRVVFSPLLLNPGDQFVLRILASQVGAAAGIRVGARIEGVSDVKTASYLREGLTSTVVMVVCGGVAVLISYIMFNVVAIPGFWAWLFVPLYMVGFAYLSVRVFYRPEGQRRAIRRVLVEQYTGERRWDFGG